PSNARSAIALSLLVSVAYQFSTSGEISTIQRLLTRRVSHQHYIAFTRYASDRFLDRRRLPARSLRQCQVPNRAQPAQRERLLDGAAPTSRSRGSRSRGTMQSDHSSWRANSRASMLLKAAAPAGRGFDGVLVFCSAFHPRRSRSEALMSVDKH